GAICGAGISIFGAFIERSRATGTEHFDYWAIMSVTSFYGALFGAIAATFAYPLWTLYKAAVAESSLAVGDLLRLRQNRSGGTMNSIGKSALGVAMLGVQGFLFCLLAGPPVAGQGLPAPRPDGSEPYQHVPLPKELPKGVSVQGAQ